MKASDPNRSDTLRKMYPDDKMIEAFGTITPEVNDRADHRNNLWDEWAKKSVLIPMAGSGMTIQYKVVLVLQESGYKEPFDYQCRPRSAGGVEFRFKNEDDLANFKLTIAEAKLSW